MRRALPSLQRGFNIPFGTVCPIGFDSRFHAWKSCLCFAGELDAPTLLSLLERDRTAPHAPLVEPRFQQLGPLHLSQRHDQWQPPPPATRVSVMQCVGD